MCHGKCRCQAGMCVPLQSSAAGMLPKPMQLGPHALRLLRDWRLVQVEFLKLLYDRMVAVHGQNVGTPHEWRFPRPSFKVSCWTVPRLTLGWRLPASWI